MPCGKFFGYRTISHFGFNSPQFPIQSHFHVPLIPSKYVPLRRSKSMDEIFATNKFLEEYNQCSPNLITKIKRKLNFHDEPLDKIVPKYKNKSIVNEHAFTNSSKLHSLEMISEKDNNVRIPSDDLDDFKHQEALAEMGDDEVMEDNSKEKRTSNESHAFSDEMFTASLVTMTIEAVIARMIDPLPDSFDESLIKYQLTPISPAQKNLMKMIDAKLAEKSLLMQTTFLQKLQEISYSKVSPVLFQNAGSTIKNELPIDENSPEKQKVLSELWNNIPYIDFEMDATSASGTSVVLQIDEDEHQIENESIIIVSSDDSSTFSVDYGKDNVLNELHFDKNTQCETTVLMTSSDSCASTKNFSFSTPTQSINNLFANEDFYFGCTSLSESEGECANKATPTSSRIPIRPSCGFRSSTSERERNCLIDKLSCRSTCSLKSSERPSFTRHSSSPLKVISDTDLVVWRDSKYDDKGILATTRESIGGSFIIRRSVTKSINKRKRNFINENIQNISRFSNPKKGNPSSIFASGNPFNDDDGSVSTFEKKKTSKDNCLWLSFSPSLSASKKKKEKTPKSAKVFKSIQKSIVLEKTKLVIDEIMLAQQKNDQDLEKSRIKELDDLDEIHNHLSDVCCNLGVKEPVCNLKQCNNDLENIVRMHQELEKDRQQHREEMDAKNNNDLNFLRGISLNLSENDD